jgi:hypothetical protein
MSLYKNSIINFITVFIIGSMLLMTGCASTGSLQVQKPMTASLGSYKILAVDVLAQSAVSEEDMEKELAGMIVVKLREKNLFEKVYSTRATVEKTFDLKLVVNLTSVTKVGSNARVWLGAFAGQGVLEGDVQIIDGKSSQVLAKATVQGTTSAGTAFSGTTSQAVERMAEQVVDFVAKNR